MDNIQVLGNLEKILKYEYLPLWKNLINEQPSAFLAKIAKPELISDIIKTGAPFGINGGFGSGPDGGNVPLAGAQAYEGFELRSANMYCTISISDKTVKLGGSNGAIIDAAHNEIESAYKAAEWNVARMLFGNGTGILTSCTFESTSKANIGDAKFVIEGLTVDIYASANKTKVATARIKEVDRNNSTVTFWGDVTGITAGETEYFLTVQNSYNAEITGIGAIFDDNITSLYGVKKADNAAIKPVIKDADGDISDAIIRDGLRTALRHKNGKIDTLMCGDGAFDAYSEYLRVNNIRVETKTKEIQGGFKAISFLFDNREIDIIEESFVPKNEIWGVDSTVCEFHNLGWDFATYQGGSIFNLIPGQSTYNALLANYGNLMVKNPGGCLRIHNVGNAA